MKRYLIILIMSSCIFSIYAEKIEDRYVSRTVPDGLLFFICPFELPNCQKMPAAELDITYLITNDTLTLNMSVYLSSIISLDSIKFTGYTNKTIANFETFYIDKKKKRYVHRYSCKLPYKFWVDCYNSDKPFLMSLYAGDNCLDYGFSAKEWSNECGWMRQVLEIINRNKK